LALVATNSRPVGGKSLVIDADLVLRIAYGFKNKACLYFICALYHIGILNTSKIELMQGGSSKN